MKILFTGGGTGGHIMPLIAVGREVKAKLPEADFYYIGPKDDCLTMSQENFKTKAILSGKIRSYFSFENVIDVLMKIPVSFIQSFFLLSTIKPNLVFSKGGTGSFPVTYCARVLKIPVFIHESDSYPGKSNKLTSKWAKKVFTSFQKTGFFNQNKIIVVGNPIRKEILNGNKEEAKRELSLELDKPVILITGGSQGSSPINEFIIGIINLLLEKYQVIHIAGPKKYRLVKIETDALLKDNSSSSNYHLYEFLNQVQLKNALLSCDLVISRAGAGSIFEIASLGKPSILIPLSTSANNHQSKNAYSYAKSGACIVIEQEDLTIPYFMGQIENIMANSQKMSLSALGFAKPNSAEIIAEEIIKELNSKTV